MSNCIKDYRTSRSCPSYFWLRLSKATNLTGPALRHKASKFDGMGSSRNRAPCRYSLHHRVIPCFGCAATGRCDSLGVTIWNHRVLVPPRSQTATMREVWADSQHYTNVICMLKYYTHNWGSTSIHLGVSKKITGPNVDPK